MLKTKRSAPNGTVTISCKDYEQYRVYEDLVTNNEQFMVYQRFPDEIMLLSTEEMKEEIEHWAQLELLRILEESDDVEEADEFSMWRRLVKLWRGRK